MYLLEVLKSWHICPELRAEIERLKTTPNGMTPEVHSGAMIEVALLRDKLIQSQKLLAESTR